MNEESFVSTRYITNFIKWIEFAFKNPDKELLEIHAQVSPSSQNVFTFLADYYVGKRRYALMYNYTQEADDKESSSGYIQEQLGYILDQCSVDGAVDESRLFLFKSTN